MRVIMVSYNASNNAECCYDGCHFADCRGDNEDSMFNPLEFSTLFLL
jgi:hypothetical protein